MTHRNAPLSELGRLKLARFHVESGSSIRATAERFQVSTTTVVRWSARYRAVLGVGRRPTIHDMVDVSSRPHRSPARTHRRVEKRVKHLRIKRRLGPVQIAGRVGIPASTVHRILVREGLNRLDHLDRATGEVIRYERDAPGDLVHVDVKKFGLIPAGGGWRVNGRRDRTGKSQLEAQRRQAKARRGTGRAGYAYVHSAVDDRTRLAYSEVHDDETSATATAFLHRTIAFFAQHGITIRQVMTDNGAAYVSGHWAQAMTTQRIEHLRTRAYRPQTNGKVCEYRLGAAPAWSDSGQGVTEVSCVRFVGQVRCSTAVRAGQAELTS